MFPSLRLSAVLALALLPFGLMPRTARSQALPTQQKAADVQVGAVYSFAFPSCDTVTTYCSGEHFYGPGAFVDVDLRHHIGVEGNISVLNRPDYMGITEKSYQVGGRYHIDAGARLRPYVRVDWGRGVFNYGYFLLTNPTPPPATLKYYNNTIAYNLVSIGGGLDYRLTRSINLRVIDFQRQIWFNFPDDSMTPVLFSAGVAYHFH